VNHINDAIQTFIRPTAGAIVFAASAQVITEINPVLSLAAGLFVAGGVHAVKSLAIRPLVTATTAGIGDVPVSIAEDIISTAISILSIIVPVLVFIIVLVVIAWIVHKYWLRENQRRLLKP
jgi:heme/copper-type cytochrome/quinol oxidase subunit 2